MADGKRNVILAHYSGNRRIVNVMVYICYSVGKANDPSLESSRLLAVCMAFDTVAHLVGEV